MGRLHRFHVEDIALKKDFWLHDQALLWQWNKVMRFREGQEVVLFDGLKTDRLYTIIKLDKTEAHLVMVTELERLLPIRHVYLLWSLLKKDNNDYILQKATELGVTNFVPLITDRTIKTEFNHERSLRIVKEAAEQCGRSDIPFIREAVHLKKALDEYTDLTLFIAQQGHERSLDLPDKLGLVVGPEGGWSPDELDYFKSRQLVHFSISQFTLRAETAAIVAAAKVL